MLLRTKILYLIVLFAALINVNLRAQEEEEPQDPFTPQTAINSRTLGDQSFAISVGLFIPIAFQVLRDDPGLGVSAGTYTGQLKIGGVGSLAYNAYLGRNLKVGLRVTGQFAADINGNYMYQIPITARATWEFHPWSRISIPVFLGIGVDLISWKQNLIAAPIFRPGFGVYFDWNAEWSFGLDISYWFVPQIKANDPLKDVLGHFMDVMLAAEYHF